MQITIAKLHDPECPCKDFVRDKLDAIGSHRVALRLQQVEKENTRRARILAAKRKAERC